MINSAVNEDNPKSLADVCLEYLAQNVDAVVLDHDGATDTYRFKPGISLPHPLGDKFLQACSDAGVPLDRRKMQIFWDLDTATLKRINLEHVHDLLDEDLEQFLIHKPVELSISPPHLTSRSLELINACGDQLTSLNLGIHSSGIFSKKSTSSDCEIKKNRTRSRDDQVLILRCPNLNTFAFHSSISELIYVAEPFILDLTCDLDQSLNLMRKLTSLDLSNSTVDMKYMHSLQFLAHLQVLNLHNVPLPRDDPSSVFRVLTRVTSLRVLDLGQSQSEEPTIYGGSVTDMMKQLVDGLPRLSRLDISGTNLAGEIPNEDDIDTDAHNRINLPIPWLESRQMEYLGLLNCLPAACERENLPATQVTGNANEEQIQFSMESYIDRKELLLDSLNNLYLLLAAVQCSDQMRAVKNVITAMKTCKMNSKIQISASACMFFILKNDPAVQHLKVFKRRVIGLLLDAIQNHPTSSSIVRNVCLVFENFELPSDSIIEIFDRLISLLLECLRQATLTDVHQRILYLMSVLTRCADMPHRKIATQLGSVTITTQIIKGRLNNPLAGDDTIQYAWDLLCCITDGTPLSCSILVEENGMGLMTECLKKNSDNRPMLSSMLCTVMNISEVDFLRPKLMHTDYLCIYRNLLDKDDDVESFSACSILSHIMSDGPDIWTLTDLQRDDVLHKMADAILRWKFDIETYLNYSTFLPFVPLLKCYDTPQVQHFSLWALGNLDNKNKNKYRPIFEKENILEIVEQVQSDPRPYPAIKELAMQIISRGQEEV